MFLSKVMLIVVLCCRRSVVLHQMASSQIRQKYDKEVEDVVNIQINIELHASYVYLSMAYHFQRDDVALPGLATFFTKSSDEERGHAQKLMKLQNDRGGRIKLTEINKPGKDEWGNALQAMEKALALEKWNNECLWRVHETAMQADDGHGDAQMTDFIEAMLQDQMLSMKKVADHVTNLRRVGAGVGEYLYDKHTMATAEP